MPFAIGKNPTIRTLNYLKKSPFHLNNKIKVFSAHLVIDCDRSKGMWYVILTINLLIIGQYVFVRCIHEDTEVTF